MSERRALMPASTPGHTDSLFETLPDGAKRFYRHADVDADITNMPMTDRHRLGGNISKTMGLCLIYPIARIRYLAANEFAVALVDGNYKLIVGPGLRWVIGWNDKMYEKRPVGTTVLHGTIKIIRVDAGFIKVVTDIRTGQPLLLGPGLHYFNDPNISVPEEQYEIDMNFRGESALRTFCKGSFTFIFVRTGEAAVICRQDGRIDVLNAGLHFIQAPTSFRTFVSVQQEHFRFGSCESHHPTFLTADNVELCVEATLFYRLLHVEQAFTTSISNKTDLHETLHSQAISTLMMIIRSENFSNLGRRTTHLVDDDETHNTRGTLRGSTINSASVAESEMPVAYASEVGAGTTQDGGSGGGGGGGGGGAGPTAPDSTIATITKGFQNIIHDAEPFFKKEVQSRFGDRFGFQIDSLRIENITFADKHLQKHVSDFAVSFTKLSAQQATIEAERQVQRATAEREAETQQIRAEAESRVKMIAVKATMDSRKLEAQTEADATRIKTEADVDAIMARGSAEADVALKKGETQAQVLRKVGEAEADVLRTKSEVPNAALSLILDAQVKSMAGTEKVIYCDTPQMLLQQVGDIIKGAQGAQGAASSLLAPSGRSGR